MSHLSSPTSSLSCLLSSSTIQNNNPLETHPTHIYTHTHTQHPSRLTLHPFISPLTESWLSCHSFPLNPFNHQSTLPLLLLPLLLFFPSSSIGYTSMGIVDYGSCDKTFMCLINISVNVILLYCTLFPLLDTSLQFNSALLFRF